jgi:hypothetical protein
MSFRTALVLLVVLVQVLGSTTVDAQPTLNGTVRDRGGSVLPGVTVKATGPALDEPRTAVTDREGRYAFGDLAHGTYTITFTLPGFVETSRSDIALPAGAAHSVDVVMRVGSLAETVVVRGQRPGEAPTPRDQPPATCTLKVLPVDPSPDPDILREPDATTDFTIKSVPPPCEPSHRLPAR